MFHRLEDFLRHQITLIFADVTQMLVAILETLSKIYLSEEGVSIWEL